MHSLFKSLALIGVLALFAFIVYDGSRIVDQRVITVQKVESVLYTDKWISVVTATDGTRYAVGQGMTSAHNTFIMDDQLRQGGTFLVSIGSDDPLPTIKKVAKY